MSSFSDDSAVRVILEQNLALREREAIGAGERPDQLRVRLSRVLNNMDIGLAKCVDERAVMSSRTAVSALLDEHVRATYGTGLNQSEWVAAAHEWDALLGETFYSQLDQSLQWVETRDVGVSAWAIVRAFQLALALGFDGRHPRGTPERQPYVARLNREAERCRGQFLAQRRGQGPERPSAPEAPQKELPPADVLRAEFVIGVGLAIALIVAMWFLC